MTLNTVFGHLWGTWCFSCCLFCFCSFANYHPISCWLLTFSLRAKSKIWFIKVLLVIFFQFCADFTLIWRREILLVDFGAKYLLIRDFHSTPLFRPLFMSSKESNQAACLYSLISLLNLLEIAMDHWLSRGWKVIKMKGYVW